MQLCLLHLDDALKSQTAFMQTCARDGARHIELRQLGSEVRLWGWKPQLDQLQIAIKSGDDAQLCFMGSGDFHHVTALLLENALEKHSGQITVIHFDNHPDWVNFAGGMHCGSWVNRAATHSKVEKIITIGVCSKDLKNPHWKGANLDLLASGKLELFPYSHAPSRIQNNQYIHWQTIEEIGEQAFIDMLLTRIKTKNIYITIDKDVLVSDDAETNWDQGMMRLPFMLQALRKIGEHHTIIGADVNGDYSKPSYSGSAWTRLKKHAEILIDQPRRAHDMSEASALNSATNHALLDVLSEVMA